MYDILVTFVVLLFALIGGVIVIRNPHIGAALTISSSAIIELIPPIPFLSSAIPLLGAVTLFGYLINIRGVAGKVQLNLSNLHFVSLLFIIWIFISNPQAAWLGPERNWIFTFVQLLVLMIMAMDILDDPRKHHAVMAIFAVIAVFSAYTAITQGHIGEDIDSSTRAVGFTAGANDAARYFVVAMIFTTYLRTQVTQPLHRFLLFIAIIITYLGVFFTTSRTGMVLLLLAQLLLFYFQHEGKQRLQLMIIFGVAFILLITLANPILSIISGILPSITQGTDTVGLRYDLWRAGWMMWLDHPFTGVGIGQFVHNSSRYMSQLPGVMPRELVAHNIYIQILAETGIIGLILFISIVAIAMSNFIKARRIQQPEQLNLRNTWLIVLIVMLIGGLTKTDQADKLLWMVLGLSVYFSRLVDEAGKEKAPAEEIPKTLWKQNYAKRQ